MSSPDIDFTPAARVDLRRIVRFSRSRWGSDQAAIYRAMLDDAFDRMAAFAAMGSPVDE